MNQARGFTLIELLIVIGILAILATTVTLVLNPVEILRQTRDVQRLSDLKTVKQAIDFYIIRVNMPNLDAANLTQGLCNDATDTGLLNDGNAWYASVSDGDDILSSGKQPFYFPMTSLYSPINGVVPEETIRAINGEGWVPVNLLSATGGSVISKLPNDPNPDTSAGYQNGGRYYAYKCEGLRYELNANMESDKYSYGGTNDVESKDGGMSACSGVGTIPATRCTQAKAYNVFEIGNDPGLDL